MFENKHHQKKNALSITCSCRYGIQALMTEMNDLIRIGIVQSLFYAYVKKKNKRKNRKKVILSIFVSLWLLLTFLSIQRQE